MTRAPRDRSLDVFKGLLVVLMTYCHVVQFFGDASLFPALTVIEQLINLVVFPGFMFAFGVSCARAYFSKPFKQAAPRMAMACMKTLLAFYLSGFAFRVLREGKPFASGIFMRILLLQDVPGWSEFLASFAALALLSIILHPLMRRMRDEPVWLLPLGLGCLALTFIPYSRIAHPLVRLYLGTNSYASFPVLQYLPYYLAGLYFAWRSNKHLVLSVLSAAATMLGAWRALSLGHLPERFPPEAGWILLPAAAVALLMLLANGVSLIRLGRADCLHPQRPLSALGRHSLYYLLAGNLTLFTLAGRGVVPQMKFKAAGLFGQPVQAPLGAIWWTVALLMAAWFVSTLAKDRRAARGAARSTAQRQEVSHIAVRAQSNIYNSKNAGPPPR